MSAVPLRADVNILTNGPSTSGSANWSMTSAPTGSTNAGSFQDLLFQPANTNNLYQAAGNLYAQSLNVTNGGNYTLAANNSLVSPNQAIIRPGNTPGNTATNFVNSISGGVLDLIYLANGSSFGILTSNLSTGDPLTVPLQQAGNFNVRTGCTLTINVPITGSSSKNLVLTGGGTNIFGGTNAYGGTTLVTNGTTLILSGAIANSSGNAITVETNSTLNEVTSGTLAGTMPLTINAGGTAILKGTNTYSGITKVVGALQVSGAAALSGASTLNSGGSTADPTTFNLSTADSGYVMNTCSIGGIMRFTGPASGFATLTFTNGGAFTGSAATKKISVGTNLTVVINGASFDLANAAAISRDHTFQADGQLTFNAPLTGTSPTYTYGFTKTGEGTMTISGTSTYNGSTTISAGTLKVLGTAALPTNTTLATGSSQSDSTLLDLASSGAYAVSNLTLSGILRVSASGGAATLTIANASTLTGSANKTVSASNNVSVIFNSTLDLSQTSGNTNGGRNLNLTGPGTVTFNNALTLVSPNPTNVDGFTLAGPGSATLNGANTYNGNTSIEGGTLFLGAGGTLASSTNLIMNGGATLNVTAKGGGGFTLGASQTLQNTAASNTLTATLAGNISAASAGIVLSYTNGIPAFTLTNGTLTLSAGTAFTLTNTGAALAAGSYKLIAKTTGGAVGGAVTASTLAVGGNGASGAATLAITGGELFLNVSSSLPSTGTNITLHASGSVLTLSWPANYIGWLLQSNSVSLTSSGNWFNVPGADATNTVSLPVNPAKPQVFFRMAHP